MVISAFDASATLPAIAAQMKMVRRVLLYSMIAKGFNIVAPYRSVCLPSALCYSVGMEKASAKDQNPGVVAAIGKAKGMRPLSRLIGCKDMAIRHARDTHCTADMAIRISNVTGVRLRRFGYRVLHP